MGLPGRPGAREPGAPGSRSGLPLRAAPSVDSYPVARPKAANMMSAILSAISGTGSWTSVLIR